MLAASNVPEARTALANGPERLATGESGIELALIRHISDGSPEDLRREMARFVAAPDEAMGGIAAALASGSKADLSAAAYRILSHARMAGASMLAGTAADLQDYASVYTESELSLEIATLRLRAASQKAAMGRPS